MPPKSSSSSHEAPSQGTFFLYRMQGSFPTLLSTHPQNKIHWSTWEEVFINKSDITYLLIYLNWWKCSIKKPFWAHIIRKGGRKEWVRNKIWFLWVVNLQRLCGFGIGPTASGLRKNLELLQILFFSDQNPLIIQWREIIFLFIFLPLKEFSEICPWGWVQARAGLGHGPGGVRIAGTAAGQGRAVGHCTDPAAVSLLQGAKMGPWAMSRVGEPWKKNLHLWGRNPIKK